MSPQKLKIHRHKHSNSDTIVKSSFKSSHYSNLASKYTINKAKSPENPSLLITKKPIEAQVEQESSKKFIMSKVAGNFCFILTKYKFLLKFIICVGYVNSPKIGIGQNIRQIDPLKQSSPEDVNKSNSFNFLA